jgi:hypothetical protein
MGRQDLSDNEDKDEIFSCEFCLRREPSPRPLGLLLVTSAFLHEFRLLFHKYKFLSYF